MPTKTTKSKADALKAQRAEKTAADTLIGTKRNGNIKETATDTEIAPNKRLVSFFADPETYAKLQNIVSFRAAAGEKNSKGHPYSAGQALNECIEEYVQNHQKELEAWDAISAQLEQFKNRR